MAMTDFGTISVDPAVLVETAEAAHRQIASYRQGLETIAKLVAASGQTWTGEAGDAYREVFKAELAKVEAVLDEYATYPSELLEYHDLYSEVIDEAQRRVSSVSEYPMF